MSKAAPAQKSAEKAPAFAAPSRQSECLGAQPALPFHPILGLQRAVGNQAVMGLFRAGFFQAKLAVGQPDDPYEREADRVAGQVMAAPFHEAATPRAGPVSLQRKCAACAAGGSCPKCEEEEETRRVQRQISGPAASGAQALPSDFLQGLGPGHALDSATRAFMESRFEHDFSSVRVHSDGHAPELARAINARAFTAGQEVVFGAGEYAPHSMQGRRLLAHELTHVVQQAGGRALSSAPQSALPSSQMSRSESPRIQRQFQIAGLLIGEVWLRLPRSLKLELTDRGIDSILAAIDLFPGRELLGELWVFVKEGLTGFYQKLRSAAEDTKILVLDKIARIMAGKSLDYTKGLLIGLLKGFFLDGLLGIFIAIWDLLKGLKHLWGFFEQVGEIIGGFPEEILKIVEGFKSLGKELLDQIGPGIEELKHLLTDPEQLKALATEVVEKGKGLARKAGEKVAQALLDLFSKPGAEAEIGEVAGRGVGMVLFEVIFAIVTAGGGAAVTGAKTALKTAAQFLGKLAGKIVGSVLKLFRELHAVVELVVDGVKAAAKFLKGKILSRLGGKLGELLERIKTFVKLLLEKCVEHSAITCDLTKKAVKAAKKAFHPNILKSADEIRAEARAIFYKANPHLKGRALEIDHRVPLEWRRLFPELDPNRMENLRALTREEHRRKVSDMWDAFRNTYRRLKRQPTPQEVLDFAKLTDKSLELPYPLP